MKQPPMKQPPKYTISGVTIQNNAAPTSEHQSRALEALAQAAAENAKAIGKIADALKGAEAHMRNGISLGGDE